MISLSLESSSGPGTTLDMVHDIGTQISFRESQHPSSTAVGTKTENRELFVRVIGVPLSCIHCILIENLTRYQA